MASFSTTGRGPVLDDADVAAFEHDLGVRLPSDYVDFLLGWNGGAPHPESFAFHEHSFSVEMFYALRAKAPLDDLVTRIDALRGIVPPQFIPIGRDRRNNLLCLRVRGGDLGVVTYLAIDRASWRTCHLPTHVAETFRALIDGLRPAAVAPD